MQTPAFDSFNNAPRRNLDIEDYFDIVRRHVAWIAGPAFAGLVIAVVVAFLWPDTYVSSATIRVVPPQVPENLVPTNINSAMAERINAMYQTVSSRNNLTNMINELNLYPRQRQQKPLADVVEQMRNAIRIGSVGTISERSGRDFPAFYISFSYENRLLAQKVTEQFVGRFMSENARERTQSSVMTTQFLKEQVEGAKKELDALDTKLSTYRQNFQGRLPEQTGQNQMQLSLLEQRASNINGAMARVSQDKMLLESDLRSLKVQKAALITPPELAVQKRRNALLDQQDREILQLEIALANLREHYRDTYPDVQRVMTQISAAKKVREKLVARAEEEEKAEEANPQPKRADLGMEREGRVIDAAIERLETQLKTKAMETDSYQRDLASVERQISGLQQKISAAPASEQQYGELIRDQSLAKIRYEEMNRKSSQSSLAEDLERRQQGERLELVDSASLPVTPTEPKRHVIVGAGLGLGLVIGLALAGAREAKDSTLKNLKDVRAYTKLTVLGSIPLLENDLVVRRRKRLAWLAWSTGALVGILVMTGAVFYYYATKI